MNTPSSSSSYSEDDVRRFVGHTVEHVTKCLQTLKVREMNELLLKKNEHPTGYKPEKARRVAELYTREEIREYTEKRKRGTDQWTGELASAPTLPDLLRRRVE